LNVHKSRENPRNLCENEGQRVGREFAAAPSFGLAPLRDCRGTIVAPRSTKRGRPLGGGAGSRSLRIFLLGAVFALANPLAIHQGQVQAREFDLTSTTPMIGGWWRTLVRPDRAEEPPRSTPDVQVDPGVEVDKQLMSLPDPKAQPLESEESENPAQETEPPAEPAPNAAQPIPNAAPRIPNAAQRPAPDGRPLSEVDQYLWSVYQRSGTKRDSTGDFTWKDEAAAARLGLLTQDYVIGGMDPDFRELLYDLGHAMDADGIKWTILSAFRDDYRQSIASGFKAHRGYSFHGGSIATGGYGHGCAADLGGSDGSDSGEVVWKWLDQHGAEFRIHRPMRQSDPAHVQPFGGWHEVAVQMRDRRVEISHADLPGGTGHIAPVVASHSGVTEAQFECVRSHHRPAEQLRIAGLSGHSKAHMVRVFDRNHRHGRWRMVADLRDIRSSDKRGGAEDSPNADETPRTAKWRTASDVRSPEKRPAAEPLLNTDEPHRNSKLHTVADVRHLQRHPGAEPLLNTDRPHRNGRWRMLADLRNPQRHPGQDPFRRHARSKGHLHFVGPVFDSAGKRS
jgi:hypothetical protein